MSRNTRWGKGRWKGGFPLDHRPLHVRMLSWREQGIYLTITHGLVLKLNDFYQRHKCCPYKRVFLHFTALGVRILGSKFNSIEDRARMTVSIDQGCVRSWRERTRFGGVLGPRRSRMCDKGAGEGKGVICPAFNATGNDTDTAPLLGHGQQEERYRIFVGHLLELEETFKLVPRREIFREEYGLW
ncbi:hypothetical protein BGY98DRAFT_933491 [Russula aff. rugulosa BPL654]|nr:hypothetical protein BGY98DRAFT_933491 [Russula aff. rugulosa BPL654]